MLCCCSVGQRLAEQKWLWEWSGEQAPCMSGSWVSDADRFQRASPAAGPICWDFSVGLGLGQRSFQKVWQHKSSGLHLLCCLPGREAVGMSACWAIQMAPNAMYSVFPITELIAHTFFTFHCPLFRVIFQAAPFSKPLFFMPVILYTSCFLSFCLQTCSASSLVRVPVFAALSCFVSQSCEHVESFCFSYECINVLCSAHCQKFRKGEMNFIPFLFPLHWGLHLLLFLLPSLHVFPS